MARRKNEPCEYCDGDMYQDYVMGDSNSLYLEMYPGKHINAITFFTNSMTEEEEEVTVSMPCNFCPNCGRKLSEF